MIAAMKLMGLGLGSISGILDPGTAQILASAIQQIEGYYPGTLAYRNNNPGNLIFVGQAGAARGEDGFARFESYEAGLDALYRQLDLYAGRGFTIQQMMDKYAPAGHGGNNPAAYAQSIASTAGVTPDTRLVDIVYPAGRFPALPGELDSGEPPILQAGLGGGLGIALAALVGLLVLSRA